MRHPSGQNRDRSPSGGPPGCSEPGEGGRASVRASLARVGLFAPSVLAWRLGHLPRSADFVRLGKAIRLLRSLPGTLIL